MRRNVTANTWTVAAILTVTAALSWPIGPVAAQGKVSRILKVGCAQMFVTGNIDSNLVTISRFMEQAAGAGVEVLVTPECALTGYGPAAGYDESRIKAALDKIAGLAKARGLYVVLGTADRADGAWRDMAYLISSRGEIAGYYSKVHLTGEDEKFYTPGDRVPLLTVKDATVGIQIGFDWTFFEGWRYLALQDAKVVFNPGNACGGDTWKVPVIGAHLRSRASENGYYVVTCNAAGPLQQVVSQILDPRGVVLAKAENDTEQLVAAELDLTRADHGFLGSRRPELYDFLLIKK